MAILMTPVALRAQYPVRDGSDGLPRSRTARDLCSRPDEDVDGLARVVELSVVASADGS